jgi:hypothetical protein
MRAACSNSSGIERMKLRITQIASGTVNAR